MIESSEIPSEIEDVSPQWLSAHLAESYPGITVSAVRAEPLHLGTASTWRLYPTYGDGSAPGPDSICIKSDFNLANKERTAQSGIYRKEASVYLDILPKTNARTPHCYAAGYDDNGRGFMLMRDLALDGGKFCDPVRSLTVDQVRTGVEQLAKLHAATWDAPFLNAPEWMHHSCPLSEVDPLWNGIFAMYDRVLESPHTCAMPSGFRDGGTMRSAFNQLRLIDDGTARCLIHGDAHVANFYVDGSDVTGMADFQCVQRGDVAHDLAMFIGSSLDIVARRNNEEALIRHYLDHLKRLGVSAPDYADAWLAYRRHYIYSLFVWLSTTEEYQPEPYLVSIVFRYGMAALDLDSLGAF